MKATPLIRPTTHSGSVPQSRHLVYATLPFLVPTQEHIASPLSCWFVSETLDEPRIYHRVVATRGPCAGNEAGVKRVTA
jgi:hypothetical protein